MKIFPRMQSIRWRLPATYAGIALLTALALGVALLLPLRAYYLQRERDFLDRNAEAIANALSPLLQVEGQPPVDLNEHIHFLSILSQVRVRLLDADQQQVADSGDPDQNRAASISFMGAPALAPDVQIATGKFLVANAAPFFQTGKPSQQARMQSGAAGGEMGIGIEQPDPNSEGLTASPVQVPFEEPVDRLRFIYTPKSNTMVVSSVPAQTGVLISVIPLASSMYGFELQTDPEREEERSDQVYRKSVTGSDGKLLGWVELSGGPAYGREIVSNVARGWLAASLIAVLFAGSVGWWVSRRMTAPLLALTAVTQRMASGDLSARADFQQADEFGSLGRSFNEMAARVESTVQTLRRFVSDAAHELHTPLTALRTNLELASVTAEQEAYLRRANEQIRRMEDLTNDLLDLSRIETGALEVAFEPVVLNDLLRLTCEPFASRAEQAGIAFDLDLPEDEIRVDGQQSQLQQAVNNLIENALKFTPSGGKMTVGMRANGSQVRIWVEDNGIGILPEDQPLLFHRFHRGRNASGYPGSGLGLSIVRAIVSCHKGQVCVESETGRTCFTLMLLTAGK